MGLSQYWRALLSLVVLDLFLGSWAYYDANCACDCLRQEQEANWGWWCQLIGSPETLFTALGVLIGVAGVAIIIIQIRQGREGLAQASAANVIALEAAKQASQDAASALKETENSVRAFIASESGRVWFSNVVVKNTADGREAKPGQPIARYSHYDLHNIGRTTVELVSVAFASASIDIGSTPPHHKVGSASALGIPLPPEGKISSIKSDRGEVTLRISSYQWHEDETRAWIGRTKQHVFYIEVIYRTTFGTYRRAYATGLARHDTINARVMTGAHYTGDEPYTP